ncbi:hypothetical protein F4808DRAFT_334593 [Astrocystis sublimbata]|nr:hypothetical protein F4808DRAFT_334593 [Astrocystis sublimbata]
MPTETGPAPSPQPCVRCKERDGVLDLRADTVCETCFATFVASKAIKRLEVLQRETRGPRLPSRPQRYLLALSCGPSSTALLHILSENVRRQRERNQRVKFELVPVFVDVDASGDSVGGGAGEADLRRATTVTNSDSAPTTSLSNHTAPPSSSSNPPSSSTSTSTHPSSTEPDPPPDAFAAQFPHVTIHRVPLSSILASPEIDWTVLPAPDGSLPPSQRLADLFARLSSPTARADVARLLTRHALLAAAATHDCGVVLLGYNTTALAELTLTEAAKGRGFGIPWLVNDGAFPLPRRVVDPCSRVSDEKGDSTRDVVSPSQATTNTMNGHGGGGGGAVAAAAAASMVQIYSPLREIFRKEILTYLSVTPSVAASGDVSLTKVLFPSSSSTSPISSAAAIVSHRDLSLDDVVARYFVDVEASYPSVVANVVRTTGKLNRSIPSKQMAKHIDTDIETDVERKQCGLCSGRLDPLGDERWKGEIGEADADIPDVVDASVKIKAGGNKRLCYGCERSVRV